jgi:hypothetical protein
MGKLKTSLETKIPMRKLKEVKSPINLNRMSFNRERNENNKMNEYIKNVRS